MNDMTTTLKPAFVTQIENVVNQSLDRIRAHPFILAGHSRDLSLDQAIRWVMCAGRESRAFPHILENMIHYTDNTEVREILKDNLDDEYGHGNPEHAHFMHYLQLLEGIGVTQETFEAYEEKSGMQLALSLAYNISLQKNQGIALGYMLVNEGMTGITYSAMKNAFTHHYPDIDTAFFDVHIYVDEHHVMELYEAVRILGVQQLEDVLFGIALGERGMAVLLDEALGIYDHCPFTPEYSTRL